MTKAIECAHTVEGAGPPLFLIHGIGAARDAWRFMVPELSKHFTVITYDLRGHGTNEVCDVPFGLDELVEDLEHIRAKLGFEQAHFAGHSLGGMIGPAYALKYPERVLSLGLLSTAAGRTEDDSSKVWGVVKAMETDDFIAQNPTVIERRLKQVIDTDAEVFLNVFRIYAGTEMAPWLHKVNAPSLILTGENDGGCNPRLNTFIDQQMPNSELVILPDYKHSILVEAPKDVTNNIIRFIQKVIK